MVNGEEYAWEDVQVALNGRVIEGISEVEYTTEREFNEVRGRGSDPHTLGRGNKTYSGKLVMLQSEVEGIQRGLPRGKDITDVRGEITISYAPEGGLRTTDQVKYVRFTKVGKALKNGDGNMVVELPFKSTKILYNI
jgi:hypothetical protein